MITYDKGLNSQSWFFSSHVWRRGGPWQKKDWVPQNDVLNRCWKTKSPLTRKRDQTRSIQRKWTQLFIEGLMVKLETQCYGHLMGRAAHSLKRPMLGKISYIYHRDEIVGWASTINVGKEFEQTRQMQKTGRPDMLQSTGSQRVGHHL